MSTKPPTETPRLARLASRARSVLDTPRGQVAVDDAGLSDIELDPLRRAKTTEFISTFVRLNLVIGLLAGISVFSFTTTREGFMTMLGSDGNPAVATVASVATQVLYALALLYRNRHPSVMVFAVMLFCISVSGSMVALADDEDVAAAAIAEQAAKTALEQGDVIDEVARQQTAVFGRLDTLERRYIAPLGDRAVALASARQGQLREAFTECVGNQMRASGSGRNHAYYCAGSSELGLRLAMLTGTAPGNAAEAAICHVSCRGDDVPATDASDQESFDEEQAGGWLGDAHDKLDEARELLAFDAQTMFDADTPVDFETARRRIADAQVLADDLVNSMPNEVPGDALPDATVAPREYLAAAQALRVEPFELMIEDQETWTWPAPASLERSTMPLTYSEGARMGGELAYADFLSWFHQRRRSPEAVVPIALAIVIDLLAFLCGVLAERVAMLRSWNVLVRGVRREIPNLSLARGSAADWWGRFGSRIGLRSSERIAMALSALEPSEMLQLAASMQRINPGSARDGIYEVVAPGRTAIVMVAAGGHVVTPMRGSTGQTVYRLAAADADALQRAILRTALAPSEAPTLIEFWMEAGRRVGGVLASPFRRRGR